MLREVRDGVVVEDGGPGKAILNMKHNSFRPKGEAGATFGGIGAVKGGVRMMKIRWMNSDVNRPSGIDEGRRRR